VSLRTTSLLNAFKSVPSSKHPPPSEPLHDIWFTSMRDLRQKGSLSVQFHPPEQQVHAEHDTHRFRMAESEGIAPPVQRMQQLSSNPVAGSPSCIAVINPGAKCSIARAHGWTAVICCTVNMLTVSRMIAANIMFGKRVNWLSALSKPGMMGRDPRFCAVNDLHA
jgi:type IV secretory pathway VirB2 component (pilin)